MKTDEMQPGDIRLFTKGDGNTVVLAIGIWAAKRGNQLHIDITRPKDFHTTVTSDPNSERYHRTLFRNLRKILIDNNCWRFGNEGEETEKTASV